ncbi:GMP synthase (glutamine-hydrolyzing) [Methylohalomonas lacus]|uniref:GMP synthase (Glutamine-hydrolyzing) n=1 Tax=Methylohalomonas lacus TaxID=398773 RepID=A0AAE3HN25_9GAMM|nr:glutamine amidotransferase [Methylohalomonas lacus]MCS3904231.1 GMP synthase (glutamine-hydrolyzing) [Methylohalomonas lacus]
MREAIAIRHVAFEDLGSLAQYLPALGYDIRYIDAGREPLSLEHLTNTDLLIVLGGPISANDEALYPFLAEERQAIEQRIEQKKPTLGLCLGAQLIARALGARVYPAAAPEIGWAPVELTAAGRNSCLRHLDGLPVIHWHGETFELPPTAVHLARSASCEHQAFQLEQHTLALQFHPEVDAAELESWYIGHTLELTQAGIDINLLRQQGRERAPALAAAAHDCLSDWLRQQTN